MSVVKYLFTMRTYIRLLAFVRPHARIFVLATLCMGGSTLLNGVQTGAFIPLIDRVVGNHPIPIPAWLPGWLASLVSWINTVPPVALLTFFACAIPVLFLLKGVLEFLQTFFMNDASQRVICDLRQKLFDKFISLPLGYHLKHPTGATMSRILYDTGMVQNSITEGITDLVYQTMQIGLYLTIVFALHWRLALITFVLVPVVGYATVRVGRILKKLSQRTQVVVGELNSTLLESLTGIQVIQAFLMEQTVRQRFASDNNRFYRLNRKIVSVGVIAF